MIGEARGGFLARLAFESALSARVARAARTARATRRPGPGPAAAARRRLLTRCLHRFVIVRHGPFSRVQAGTDAEGLQHRCIFVDGHVFRVNSANKRFHVGIEK